PRWGRNEEGYGEDPVLTGEMAGAYVRGMQGGGPGETRDHLRISAALKHFFANNVEDGRCVTSSTVDARNRREYYYEPFRRCIERAGATSVMTSYNAVNGTVEMHDPRVEDLLHGEFGLYGHVVSDGGAVSLVRDARHDTDSHAETVARSLKAGVDCMTDDMDMVHAAAVEAWERGLIDEHDVDRALRRSITTKLRLGLYDAVPSNPFDDVAEADLDSPEHRALALRVAEESVVLLKNDGLLPIVSRETLRGMRDDGARDADVHDSHVDKVAVIGPLADQWFQDWYGGEPPFRSTLLDGVRRVLGGRAAEPRILSDDGLDVVLLRFAGRYAALDDDGTLRAVDDREQAERFRLQDWGDGSLTLRAQSTGLYLTAEDDGVIRAGKRIPFGWFVKEVFRLSDDGRLTTWSGVPLAVTDNGRIHALAETDLSAQRIGVPQTVAIATGPSDNADPAAASAPSTSDGAVEPGPAASATGLSDGVMPSGDASAQPAGQPAFAIVIVEHGLERAAALAGRAGTVIAAVGCCSVINGKEDADRPSTAFPPAQRALVQTLVAANPRTAMVLISNYPYDIDWEQEHVPAIVQSASGGQSMGEAIARVLFGLASPAGRLPQTWYGGRVVLPDKNDYDIIGTKRTYQWHDGDVLYPFGHGLTYVPFRYDDLRVRVASPDDTHSGNAACGDDIACGDNDVHGDNVALHASVRITNVGTVPSDEVVQIYIRHPHESGPAAECATPGIVPAETKPQDETRQTPTAGPVPMPIRRLVAFRRERAVEPGESRTVTFAIPREELRVFDVRKGDFRVPDGDYTVEAGASSRDIRASVTANVRGERPSTRPFGRWIPIDHWDSAADVTLVAAEPLPGHRASEASAATARDDDRPARVTFAGFAPFPCGARLELSGDGLDCVRLDPAGIGSDRVRLERSEPNGDGSSDARPEQPQRPESNNDDLSDLVPANDAPLPLTATAITLYIPRGATVRGVRVVR
ncbi:glycoside hydrolase family 3 C-terminal domain-containing protein, partial [Bifidobacterium amazonense]